jgi:hypothetical protein
MSNIPLQGCNGTPVDGLINLGLLAFAAYIFWAGWKKGRGK